MASPWLTSWLDSLSLVEYDQLFSSNGYTKKHHFVTVDKAELMRLGLVKVGHQNRLLRAVAKIKSNTLPILGPVDDVFQSNGVPLAQVNSEPSSHAPQSPTMTPAILSAGPASSSPPPVPLRRAHRSTATLPPHISTPSPHHTSLSGLEVPPAVKPRQQSLKETSRDSEDLPLSPSTLPHTLTRSPHKSHSTANCTATSRDHPASDSAHFQNHAPPTSSEVATTTPPLRVKPKPIPRAQKHSRSHSDQGEVPQKPVPLPRKSSAGKRREGGATGETTPPSREISGQVVAAGGSELRGPAPGEGERIPKPQEEGGRKLQGEQDTRLDIGDLPQVPDDDGGQSSNLPHPQDVEVPPAIPVKRSPRSESRRVIAPSDDIIFELEDEPIPGTTGTPVPEDIPLTTTETKTEPNETNFGKGQIIPSGLALPERDTELVSGLTGRDTEVAPPPPPPHRTSSAKTLPKSTTPPQDGVGETGPPLPQRTESTKRLTTIPPSLPENEPEETTVVPIPPNRTDSVKRLPEPATSEPQPLPDKESEEAEVVPTAPHRTNSVKNIPQEATTLLPQKEPEETTVAPPPPPHDTNSVQTIPDHTTTPPHSLCTPNHMHPPPLPAKKTPSPPPFTPPPPPSLPSPPTSPPSFTPPPPPSLPSPPTSPPPSPPTSPPPSPPASPPPSPPRTSPSPPALPPKSSETPPPPPPLSERYDTEDSSDFLSDSDDDQHGKFRSITSTSLSLKSPDSDDVLTVMTPAPTGSPLDNELVSPLTPLSSEEDTPRHIAQLPMIPQEGGVAGDIMVISPEVPPQIVLRVREGDYANQAIIDEVVGGASEGDYTDNDKIRTVRGATPIRSRTLTPDERSDYMNQEIVEGDIIPVSLVVPPADAAPVLIPDSVGLKLDIVREAWREGGPDYANIDTHGAGLPDYANIDTQGAGPPDYANIDTQAAGLADYANIDATGSNGQPHYANIDETPPEDRTGAPTTPPPCQAVPDHLSSSQLVLRQTSSPTGSRRRSMSPLNCKESALEFRGGSPHGQQTSLGSELVPLRSAPGSGCSSGATTPGALSLDSVDDYFDERQSEVAPVILAGDWELKPRSITRAAVSVRDCSSHHHEVPPLPPSSGTFACHQQNRRQFAVPRKTTAIGDALDHPHVWEPPLHERISPLPERAEDLAHVPRTKDGYLYKKGGKRSQRPWQKRWVVFSGEELKYFNDKNYKISDALNHVNLRDIIDVKRISDTQSSSEKQHRFDLVVIGRVFQFYSDSREECENWVAVLHAAIARFQPEENEGRREGGSLHDPERQGPLLKQGRGMRPGFRERYIALKGSKFAYYENKEAFINARPIHILELALANVRPDPSGKHRFIITMHNQKTYTFQAANDMERQGWLDTITDAILAGLVGGEKAPATPTKKETAAEDIMTRIQENPANRVCADCTSVDPSWGVVNMGIMVCIECSGVHRSMGILVSKVRSLELDRSIWTDSLIRLMVEIGNNRSNMLWEKHCKQERLQSSVERVIRESFIRAKYQVRSWIPEPSGEERDVLSRQLLVCVASNNLMRTIQLLVHGADVSFEDPDEPNPKLKTCLGVAKYHKQTLQVELLEQNRALSSSKTNCPTELISKKGHLFKTGNDRTGWKRRWCTLDQFRGLEYFRSETDLDCQGDIKVHEMLSVSLSDEDKDPRYPHCFELNTQSRGYLFCADSRVEMEEWIEKLKKIIPLDGAEKLGFDKVGYLRKKDPHNVGGWKRRWFTLKGKSLVYYRREREELDEIDLKKVVELKAPDPHGAPDTLCTFQICLPDRVYYLKAESASEADSWMQALRHTQVSGIPLGEQQTTSGGIPILVHKCLQFVETFGLEVEGIYRMSGNLAKIRRLILGFNQDARGFLIDSGDFTVHDVAGVLKDFFKSLPDPLLTHHLYQDFIEIMKAEHEEQLVQLKSLIQQLPPVNRETLKKIISHLNKVVDHESKNKMSRTNLVSLFAPTLMTVNADAMSMTNAKYEFSCMDKMIQYYKWLFEVKDEEEAKEKELEKAKERIMKAAQQLKVSNIGMTSTMKFLNTIYILSRSGDTYGTYITPETLVGELVEEVATNKCLPPDHYALYLVIGEGDSHRVLNSSDRLLGVLSSVGSECHLCLKPNSFYESIRPFMHLDGWESVQVHVREKRRWKKYPCAVRGKSFVQFKDNKCINEVARLPVTEMDVFAGMEKAVRTDHRNPMPTRNFFWLKPMRGLEDQAKYLCTDTEQDLQKLMAALVKAKYGPDGLQTPLLPTKQPSPDLAVRRSTMNVSPRVSPSFPQRDQFYTASVQYNKH